MDAAVTALELRARGGLHRFANPGRFLRLAAAVQPWLTAPAIVITLAGLYWGLFVSPADWQQGDAVRIMYVHVPLRLARLPRLFRARLVLLRLHRLAPSAGVAAVEIGPVGAGFTGLCLATGSLWGKPMWGAWWVWDARLTSVLILFFLYLGHIALGARLRRPAARLPRRGDPGAGRRGEPPHHQIQRRLCGTRCTSRRPSR
ncbi:MAG: cytochrome c biogenesis protein CcsA [Acetobacteraceae bacterium]